jgi:hypothetical protein
LLNVFLIVGALLFPALLVLWLRQRRWTLRTRELRRILDLADSLEKDLQNCRARLREIPALVSHLPPSNALSAHATLTAEPQVQAALHDLLQHRLWLREHADDAPIETLRSAASALSQSRDKLRTQLERLEEVRSQLAEANVSPRKQGT